MATENFGLPTISDNLANDIVSDMNALAEATDGALKSVDDRKVDKVSGKQLSTNDYTSAEKTKLAGIATGANNTSINNTLTSTSTTSALSAAQGKVLNDTKAAKADLTSLNSTVITHSGEVASSDKLGHVKVGQGLSISSDGTLRADVQEVPNASTTVAGIARLNDSLSSTSTTEAATANAINKVNLAKLNLSGGTMTGNLTLEKGIPSIFLQAPGAANQFEIRNNVSASADFGTDFYRKGSRVMYINASGIVYVRDNSGVEFSLADLKTSVADGKTLIANTISGKGASTAPTASFAEMATNINKISPILGSSTSVGALGQTSVRCVISGLPFRPRAVILSIEAVSGGSTVTNGKYSYSEYQGTQTWLYTVRSSGVVHNGGIASSISLYQGGFDITLPHPESSGSTAGYTFNYLAIP